MPEFRFREINGVSLNPSTGAPTGSFLVNQFITDGATVPTSLLAALGVSPVTHSAVEDPLPPTGFTCSTLLTKLDNLPAFNPRQPVGPRSDMAANLTVPPAAPVPPTLRFTSAPCAAVAARHARNAFDNDLFDPRSFDPNATFHNQRRQRLEWDLALACRFVQTVDREGVIRTDALNFRGELLAREEPSPTSATGRAVTTWRYNADGNLVEESRPDGGKTNIVYDSETTLFQHEVVLRRNNPVAVVELSATASHLENAMTHSLAGSGVLSAQVTTFTYEPVFQQVHKIVDPKGAETHFRYDYQQDDNDQPTAVTRYKQQTGHFGVPIFFVTPQDYDGDGATFGEASAQVVLKYSANVNLGAGLTGDVGTRITRDHSGRMVESNSIQDDLNPALDFDRTEYQYYASLERAENGLSGNGGSSRVRGPVEFTRRFRTPSSTADDDIHEARVVYDRLGGVLFSSTNDDVATVVTTTRDSLGHIVLVDAYGESTETTYDGRGDPIASLRKSGDSSVQPVATVYAHANMGLPLGACTELVNGACATFEAHAEAVRTSVLANGTLPTPLPNARYSVSVYDDDDRVIATYNEAGLLTRTQLLPAGVAESVTIGGSPSTSIRFGYDVMGRLLRQSAGSSTTDLTESFYRYDKLGRLVARETRAPLAETGFNDAVGTVDRVGYNNADEVVLRSVTGSNGAASPLRRVLETSRFERNALGAALARHDFSAGQQTSVPGKSVAGRVTGDTWVTTLYGYDEALRPVVEDPENGGTGGNTKYWSYDGFGEFYRYNGAYEEHHTLSIPRTRTRLQTVYRLGDVVQTYDVEETFDPRGNRLTRLVDDAAVTVLRNESWEYDGFGRQIKYIDPAGESTSTEYDVLGQPVVVAERNGANTLVRQRDLAWDASGRLIAESIGSSAPATTYSYDARGRLMQEISGGAKTTLTRDAAGRLATVEMQSVTGNIRTRTLEYPATSSARVYQKVKLGTTVLRDVTRDGLDRPTIASDFNIVTTVDSSDATFNGSRPTLTTTVTYDSLGRSPSESTRGTFPSTSPTLPSSTNFEVASTTVVWPLNDAWPTSVKTKRGEQLNFATNDFGGLDSVTRTNSGAAGETGLPPSPNSTTLTFGYVASDWVSATTSAGHFITKDRDSLGQVISSGLTASNLDKRFREDVLRGPTGRIVATRNQWSVRTVADLRGHKFNAVDQLTETKTDTSTSMTAGALGNLRDDVLANESHTVVTAADNTQSISTNNAAFLLGNTFDEEGRKYAATPLNTLHGTPPSNVNSLSTTRDVRDRLSGDGSLTYTFDAQDRLVRVRRGTVEEMRIAYDGLGRRRLERRLDMTSATATTTRDLVLEYWAGNVIEESTLSTAAAASTQVFMTTTHGLDLDTPMLVTGNRSSTGTRYVLGTNARGDVASVILETTGAIVEEQELDAWGERKLRRAATPTVTCVDGGESGTGNNKVSRPLSACAGTAAVLGRFGLGGGRQHNRTKLVDLRNRVYATHLRMFLTKDPLGNVDAEGLYAYVAGDPINFRDPWGLERVMDLQPGGTCVEYGGGGAGSTRCRDPDPCDAQCQETREKNRSARELVARNREEFSRLRAEAAESKAARTQQEKDDERSLLDTLAAAAAAVGDAWDGLIGGIGDAAADAANRFADGTATHPPTTPIRHPIDTANDANAAATEVALRTAQLAAGVAGGVAAKAATAGDVAGAAGRAAKRLKAVTEEGAAVAKADKLFRTNKKAWNDYQDILAMLSEGRAGKNQHSLGRELAGQKGVDFPGSGRGRGATRVVYTETEERIVVHDILDYHKK